MGYSSSKYSSAGETKGTTIVGLLYNGGILVGADSRSSNEKTRDKRLNIRNDMEKMFPISSNMIAVMSGTAIDCMKMCESVKSKCITEFKKNGGSVSYALQLMYAHLRDLPENNKNDKAFGVLMAGWDADNGLQLYRIFINKGRVTNERVYSRFTALGSGSEYATSIMRHFFVEMSNENDVADIALKALFNATFFDKFTGGTLRVYKIVEKIPYITMRGVDSLEVQNPVVCSRFDSQYYSLGEYKSRTLFLVYSTRFSQPFHTYRLINHFRQYGGKEAVEAIAAHLVVKKQEFYFHRVVFKSERDASIVWNNVMMNSEASRRPCDTFKLLESYFPYQLVLKKDVPVYEEDVPVYVDESSEPLLQLIIRASYGRRSEQYMNVRASPTD